MEILIMKKYFEISIPRSHPAAVVGCAFMALSVAIRLIYYLSGTYSLTDMTVHMILPVLAGLVYIAGVIAEGKIGVPMTVGAVWIGIVFFVLKAWMVFTPLHRNLCTILYITVFAVYTVTALGYLPTKKLLYPLFGLPLAFHIFVEDTRDYLFADPPVPYFDWIPEISVLSIMAALLCVSIAMKAEMV